MLSARWAASSTSLLQAGEGGSEVIGNQWQQYFKTELGDFFHKYMADFAGTSGVARLVPLGRYYSDTCSIKSITHQATVLLEYTDHFQMIVLKVYRSALWELVGYLPAQLATPLAGVVTLGRLIMHHN